MEDLNKQQNYAFHQYISHYLPSDQFGIALFNQSNGNTVFLQFEQQGLDSIFDQKSISIASLETQLVASNTSANDVFKLLLSHGIIYKID